MSLISKKKSVLLLVQNELQTYVPFFDASFLAILSWKQGNHALECTMFDQFLTFFTNLESSGDGQYGADTLINFSADYDLETAD